MSMVTFSMIILVVAAIVVLGLWMFGGELYERARVWSGLPPMKKDKVAEGEVEEGE